MLKYPIAANPVAIFAYNRLNHFKNTVEALKQCQMSEETVLHVFSDGAKKKTDIEVVNKIREYSNNIKGFKRVQLHFSKTNKGLAASIKDGISLVLKKHNAIIVLEDDLLTSKNFLSYMNQGLGEYKNNSKILSISGYTRPVKQLPNYEYDNYFIGRASSWGWATWRDRWVKVDWNASTYVEFIKDRNLKKEFNKMGSDMTNMLKRQMEGKINSWAIIWCYHQFRFNLLTVVPTISKISNEGFDALATHTSKASNRFSTILDNSNKNDFNFNPNPKLLNHFTKQFKKDYSVLTRIYFKLKGLMKI